MTWTEGASEAPDSGAAVLPQDANTWGNNAGWLPQPSATAQELPRQNSVGLEVYIRVAQGTTELTLGGAKSLVLNALTFGGYLRPGVALQPGEVVVQGSGHAEANIVHSARNV
jgi:filamentous hemagglutinin